MKLYTSVLLALILMFNGVLAKCPTVPDTDVLIIIQGAAIKAVSVPFKLSFAPLASFVDNEEYYIVENVLDCESGFNQGAIGKAGEIGVAQFMPSTWNWFNEMRGTNLDIHNVDDQLDMIFWAFNNDYKNHWTCYNNLYKKYGEK